MKLFRILVSLFLVVSLSTMVSAKDGKQKCAKEKSAACKTKKGAEKKTCMKEAMKACKADKKKK